MQKFNFFCQLYSGQNWLPITESSISSLTADKVNFDPNYYETENSDPSYYNTANSDPNYYDTEISDPSYYLSLLESRKGIYAINSFPQHPMLE